MRALGIVVRQPALVALLLRAQATCRRAQGFVFVNAMELLMGGVVLRAAWPGEVDGDVQAHPPEAQDRTAVGSRAGEGLTVVDADGGRQAKALEQAQESCAQSGVAAIGQDLDGQHHAGEQIAHSQRFAALAVRGAEGALEVDGPDVVGILRELQTVASQQRTWPRAVRPFSAEAAACQPTRNGALRRRGRRAEFERQEGAQLLGSPARMSVPEGNDALDQGSGEPLGLTDRSVAAFLHSRQTEFGVTGNPFVSGFAADAETLRQRAHRFALLKRRLHETEALFRQRGVFPWHEAIEGVGPIGESAAKGALRDWKFAVPLWRKRHARSPPPALLTKRLLWLSASAQDVNLGLPQPRPAGRL